MNHIIPILKPEKIGGELKPTVNARDLWEYMEIGKDFSNWIKGRISDCGFEENMDYVVFAKKGDNLLGGRPEKEYHVSIDMAKELGMIERNEKGRGIRKYFIQCEKELRDLYQESQIGFDQKTLKHLDQSTQKDSSKSTNAISINRGGPKEAARVNAINCINHTGKNPSFWKEYAKEKGFKSKDYVSGKAVIRKVNPGAAASMSLHEEISKKTNVDLQNKFYQDFAPVSTEFFNRLRQIGYTEESR